MLKSEHLRVQVRSGQLRPRWLTPESHADRERAELALALIRGHLGKRRGQLDAAIMLQSSATTDFRLIRGLTHVALAGATFESRVAFDPWTARRDAFERAAARPSLDLIGRAEVLTETAEQLGTDADTLDRGLYADLPSEMTLVDFEETTPDAVIAHYNRALAQSVLLRATEVTVRLRDPSTKRLRRIVSALKFHQLLFAFHRDGSDAVFRVDGPLSVLERSTRYGGELASFLPSLLHAERWTLEAHLKWSQRGRPVTFVLDDTSEVKASGPDRAMWSVPEEAVLLDALRAAAPGWTIGPAEELVDIDGLFALVPDLRCLEVATGRVAWIDVVWSWRKAWFTKHAQQLVAHGPRRLILAVHGAAATVPREGPGALCVPFRGVPAPTKLIAALEQRAEPVA